MPRIKTPMENLANRVVANIDYPREFLRRDEYDYCKLRVKGPAGNMVPDDWSVCTKMDHAGEILDVTTTLYAGLPPYNVSIHFWTKFAQLDPQDLT